MSYTGTHKLRHTKNAVKRIQREFGINPFLDPLDTNYKYVAGIPHEELKDWDIKTLDKLIEVKEGIKLGFGNIKNNPKNRIMINLVKFLNNNFGTSVVYEPDREPVYISYLKLLNNKEINRKYNNLNRRLAVEEFFGNIEDKIKTMTNYFRKR